jgi:hypothetical protein
VPPLQPEVLDVSAEGFGDPQPVEGEQADQGVIPGPEEAVEEGGTVGLVVVPGAVALADEDGHELGPVWK